MIDYFLLLPWFRFFFIFLITFVLSTFATFFVRRCAVKLKLVAYPGNRHIHNKPTPKGAGLALILVFVLATLIFVPVGEEFLGIFLALLLILVVGVWDDYKKLSPLFQFFWQLVVAFVAILSGISINFIANPFGGLIYLNQSIISFHLDEAVFSVPILGGLISIFWIILLMNAFNFLDGIDGLAGSIAFIGGGILFLLSLAPRVHQFDTATLALIFSASVLGFLFFNFPPARIFLGTSGSWFLGFVLAVLAIYSGGKVATAFLVLGLPILDATVVVLRRLIRKKLPWKGDLTHLHHLLLAGGWSQRRIVVFYSLISLIFGGSALFLQTVEKIMAFGALVFLVLFILFFARRHLTSSLV